MTIFLRLLEVDTSQKGATLANATARWRAGSEPDMVFQVEPSSFEQVPGAPFVYWVSERLRRLFTELSCFESEGRTLKQGLATADDFRFLRGWWEVDASALAKKWFPFAKGGSYSPFYADVHLVVNWGEGGREIWNNLNERGQVRSNVWMLKSTSTDFFFRPGLTWPSRPHLRGWFSLVPPGSIFSHTKMMMFPRPGEELALTALLNTDAYVGLLHLLMARGTGGGQTLKYEVGDIRRVPIPDLDDNQSQKLSSYALEAFRLARLQDQATQASHSFTSPALLIAKGWTISDRLSAWSEVRAEIDEGLTRIRAESGDIAFALYGIDGEDRRQLEEGFRSSGSSEDEVGDGEDDDEVEDEVEGADPIVLTEALLEWTLGVALGRFDVRLATGQRPQQLSPGPFDPLPVCSPGMLQDETSLPASEAPSGYPLELPPQGILVDDAGHPWDVVSRMEAVLDLVAGEQAHGWIQEAETLLGRSLRDWLRYYGFERHLKRYSRNRRKAPLFWHLAPRSREYGIWLYSPVATRDTMYRVLNDYVDPRLKGAERRLLELRQDASATPTGQQRRELTGQQSVVEELRTFREQVARVAPLWAPHRDDGVVLNCAVLWRLFDHHRAWQNECKAKWGELARGKYDWAGLAMHLWPNRVVERCASDRSIAIAHGLEDELWAENDDGEWKPRPGAKEQVAKRTAERRSPAIQAALDVFTLAG